MAITLVFALVVSGEKFQAEQHSQETQNFVPFRIDADSFLPSL